MNNDVTPTASLRGSPKSAGVGQQEASGESQIAPFPTSAAENTDCRKAGGAVAPSGIAPVSVRCSEWVDALAENVERKMRELYKGRCLDHDDVIVQRAVIVALGILVDALRADTESASTGRGATDDR